jgi:ribosomal protein L11 methyltransferase
VALPKAVARLRNSAMTNPNTTATFRLAADRIVAMRIADLLANLLDPDASAVSVYEADDGGWAVAGYIDGVADEAEISRVVREAAGDAAADALQFDKVATKDWVAASLAGLQPVEAGRFLVHGSHDRARVPSHRIGIEIEAALAFGTGHHGTTRGCLLALDGLLKARRPRRILDLGTGTGVLAIAAARALHRPVLASDIDMQAVRVARENAHLNRVGPLVTLVQAAGLTGRPFAQRAPYDLIFANILLGPLKRLAAPIASVLAPHARVVLSGLLAAHANAALAAYGTQGLRLERRIDLEGWTTLVLARGAVPLAPRG